MLLDGGLRGLVKPGLKALLDHLKRSIFIGPSAKISKVPANFLNPISFAILLALTDLSREISVSHSHSCMTSSCALGHAERSLSSANKATLPAFKWWVSPGDILNNQAVLNPKVHTTRAPPGGIETATPLRSKPRQSQAVALPTTPQILAY